MLEKVATIKIFEFFSLGSKLKNSIGIDTKINTSFFKDQINIVNNKREDDVKAKDDI